MQSFIRAHEHVEEKSGEMRQAVRGQAGTICMNIALHFFTNCDHCAFQPVELIKLKHKPF